MLSSLSRDILQPLSMPSEVPVTAEHFSACCWACNFPSLVTLLPHTWPSHGQKHPLIICSLCSHLLLVFQRRRTRAVLRGGRNSYLCTGILSSCPNFNGPLKTSCRPVVWTTPEWSGREGRGLSRGSRHCGKSREINEERASCESRDLDKGREMLPTPWQDFLNSAPISDSILQVLLCTYHVPTSAGLPSMSHVLCPPESWQVSTNMPPFPPLSPAERLLSWVGLISWSKPDILENVCSGTEQAGIFISRLHLHCFLSWRGAGGRREEEMWLLRASPRGVQARPSPLPSPASAAGAAWDFWRQAPFELWKDQPSWKSRLATIRPFPLTARCAFVWVACLEGSLSGG